jgi:hypothetical protein
MNLHGSPLSVISTELQRGFTISEKQYKEASIGSKHQNRSKIAHERSGSARASNTFKPTRFQIQIGSNTNHAPHSLTISIKVISLEFESLIPGEEKNIN